MHVHHANRTVANGLLALATSCAVLLGAVAPAAEAAPWAQDDALQSALTGPWAFDIQGQVVQVDFANQTAHNTGAVDRHMGMYFAWSWLRPADAGPYQSMAWDNAVQAFVNPVATLQVVHTGHAAQTLRIGDVLGDTWAGVPWAPDATYPAIAADADWVVPLFDFGVIGAGQSVTYDIRFSFTFGDAAAALAFTEQGGFASYAQGVARLPEPGSLALAALALVAGGAAAQRRRQPRGC
jgi:hypothetical protein